MKRTEKDNLKFKYGDCIRITEKAEYIGKKLNPRRWPEDSKFEVWKIAGFAGSAFHITQYVIETADGRTFKQALDIIEINYRRLDETERLLYGF